MNIIEQYLDEYVKASHSSNDEHWKNFWEKYKPISESTKNYLQSIYTFLPQNQILDFHDAYIIGNVKGNMKSDTFNLTVRLLCHEKTDDNIIIKRLILFM